MMYRRTNAAFCFFALILAIAAFAPALVERMPLERLIGEADLILSAKVLSTDSRWVPEGDGRNIYTTVTLQPGRVLKGTLPAGPVTLLLPGGTAGDITQSVSDIPVFHPGEKAVLFLRGDDHRLVGAFQGRFPVRDGRLFVEGIEVEAGRFQDAVERFARDEAFDLYGALLLEPPAVESAGTVSPFDLDRLNKAPSPPALPQRAFTANIVMVQWEYEVDYDGDGYAQIARLYWDVDVKGGAGPINIFDKVYWRLTGTTPWSLLYTTPVYSINAAAQTDARLLSIYGGSAHEYDFRIESYQEGAAALDDFADPTSNESACTAYRMESPADDTAGTGPTILEIQPEKTSAGTGTVAYIRGLGFGDGSGGSKIEFYFEGQDRIPVLASKVTSWADNAVKVKVPIGTVDGYPGTAATGPVNVYDAAGVKSASYDYRISFGYGGQKWPNTHPTVPFYIGSNITDWTDATTAAAATWGMHGNINITYAGTTDRTTSTKNDKNEIMYSNLDPGVIGQATYWSAGSVIKECDLILNSDFNWSTADTTPPGAYDVETITLHETGHWLNLRDLYGGGEDRDKVMYGYGKTGPSGMRRVPHPDDSAGVAWIYGLDSAPVADFAWFAGRPEIGASIQFQDESALQPTAWSWDFGDGSTSTLQNPSHAFLFSGTFPVTLTASNAFGSSTVTKSVIVHGRGIVPPLTTPQPYTYIVPAAAKAAGAGGTNWLSDLFVYNPNNSEASVYVYFLESAKDNSGAMGSEMLLPALRFARVGDLVGNMFRQNNISGALLLASTQPLAITSRTYNDQRDNPAIEGTYGQFIPGIPSTRLLPANEEGVLLHLVKSGDYRTNFGLVNGSGVLTTVSVSFYKADKTLIGTKSYTLAAYEHRQDPYVMDPLTTATVPDAYAVATSSTAGAAYTVYASVVDNRSSDPIFVPVQRKGDVQGQAHQVVAAAARAKGGQGSNWRTDLRLYNPFASQSVTLTYIANAGSATANLTIGQGELVSRNDVLTSLFPSISGDSSGALQVQSSQGLLMTSRTYNDQGSAGTYGQFIPARSTADMISSGQVGLLLQLASNDDFRCNIGFTEFTGQSTQVQVKIYDANRSVLGFKTYTVAASGNFQQGNVFQDLGITAQHEAAMAEIRVVSGGSVYAYASIVDNETGDAFFIPAQK